MFSAIEQRSSGVVASKLLDGVRAIHVIRTDADSLAAFKHQSGLTAKHIVVHESHTDAWQHIQHDTSRQLHLVLADGCQLKDGWIDHWNDNVARNVPSDAFVALPVRRLH
jgi:hypothetical protein